MMRPKLRITGISPSPFVFCIPISLCLESLQAFRQVIVDVWACLLVGIPLVCSPLIIEFGVERMRFSVLNPPDDPAFA